MSISIVGMSICPLIPFWTQPSRKPSKAMHIAGSEKHQLKLAWVTRDANQHQRFLTIAWLDLTNAYGSVSHQLIQFALSNYHAQRELLAPVSRLYESRQAVITCKKWRPSQYIWQLGSFRETLYLSPSSTPPSTSCWIIYTIRAQMHDIISPPPPESYQPCSMLMTSASLSIV
jgi:hypothetical protein